MHFDNFLNDLSIRLIQLLVVLVGDKNEHYKIEGTEVIIDSKFYTSFWKQMIKPVYKLDKTMTDEKLLDLYKDQPFINKIAEFLTQRGYSFKIFLEIAFKNRRRNMIMQFRIPSVLDGNEAKEFIEWWLHFMFYGYHGDDDVSVEDVKSYLGLFDLVAQQKVEEEKRDSDQN